VYLESLIEEEERESKARRDNDKKEEVTEKTKKKKNKEALIDELVRVLQYVVCLLRQITLCAGGI